MLLVADDDEFKQYEQQWQLERAIQETKVQLARAKLHLPQLLAVAPPPILAAPVIIQDDRLDKAQKALVDAQKRLLEEQKQFANLKSLSEKERIELEEKKRLLERTVNEKEQALKQVQDANANAQRYQQQLQAAQTDLNIKQQELFRAQNEVVQLKAELAKKGGYTQADVDAKMKPLEEVAAKLAAQLTDAVQFIAQLNEKYQKELGEKDALLIQKDAELAARLKRLEQADADIAAAKVIIAEKNAALSNVMADLKEAEEQSAEVIASQLAYIDGLKKQQAELEQDLQAQEKYQQDLLDLGQAQEAEINQLKQDLAKLAESEANLNIELQGMKEERAYLQTQIDKKAALEKTILSLNKQIADNKKQHLREQEQQLAHYNERKAEFQVEIAQLKSELSQAADLEKQAQDDLVAADKKIAQLQQQIDDRIQAEIEDKTLIDNLRGELDILNMDKNAQQKEIQNLQLEKQDLQQRIEQDNVEMASLTEQMKQQQKAYGELMEKLNQEVLEKQQLQAQLGDVTAKLQQAEQLQQHLERRNKALEEKLELQDAEIEALNGQVETLIDEKEQALERAAKAEALVVHKGVVIEELMKQIAVERDEKEEMKAQFEQAAGEMQQLMHDIKLALKERDEQARNFAFLHDEYTSMIDCVIAAKASLREGLTFVHDSKALSKLNSSIKVINDCLNKKSL